MQLAWSTRKVWCPRLVVILVDLDPLANGAEFTVGEDQIWQTPPLWGIADSAPYLHDGRAETFHDAIMAHGGEAQDSRHRYERLPKKYRRYLNEFLATLGSGEVNE